MSDTETLSNQLNNLFNDLRKIKAVKTKLSLHMYIDNASMQLVKAPKQLAQT